MNFECMDSGEGGCNGPVTQGSSRSGASTYEKCEAHWRKYDERMDKVHADISLRYPGYDNPHSLPPADFDPAYAGESWDGE